MHNLQYSPTETPRIDMTLLQMPFRYPLMLPDYAELRFELSRQFKCATCPPCVDCSEQGSPPKLKSQFSVSKLGSYRGVRRWAGWEAKSNVSNVSNATNGPRRRVLAVVGSSGATRAGSSLRSSSGSVSNVPDGKGNIIRVPSINVTPPPPRL